MSFAKFDSPDADSLRATRSLKWNAFPHALGAFVAESDLGTAPEVSAALHHAVDHLSLGYRSRPIVDPVLESVVNWQAKAGWEVETGQVRLVADVVTSLTALLERMVEPDLPVVLPLPNYMPFLTLPQRLGRELITVPSTQVHGYWSLDLAAIEAALTPRGGVFILTNPWNPVGRALSHEELLGLSEVMERTGALVFSDEIHAPLVFPGHTHLPYASLSPATAQHTITAVSASKAWNTAGLKCAQLIFSNPQHAVEWDKFAGLLAEPSTLGLYATVAAYEHGGAWLQDFLAYVAHNRDTLQEGLSQALSPESYRPPQATYLAWVDLNLSEQVRTELLRQPAKELLKSAGVAVTDGEQCGHPGAFRLNLATPHAIFEEITQRIVDSVSGL